MPYADINQQRKYQREYQRKWRKKSPERHASILRISDLKRRFNPVRIEQSKKAKYRQHHRNKINVMLLYGKCCAMCGNDKYEVLCVDHIKNNGAEHRRSLNYKKLNSGGMWGVLSKSEYRPDLYRILCWNCNMARQKYKIDEFGYMPFEYWDKMSQVRKKENKNE